MAVFDSRTKIVRRVVDPGSDYQLPQSGNLSYDSMPSAAALGGVTGIDCMCIHGNASRAIDGDEHHRISGAHTKAILGQETYSVGQSQMVMITGPVTHTIQTDLNSTVMGTHNSVNIGPHNASFVSSQIESRQSPKSMEEPAARMESTGEKIEWLSYGKFELNAAANVEINTGLKTEITNLGLAVVALKGEATMGEQQSKALEQKMQGLANRIMGVNSELGGGEADAKPEVNVFVVFIPDGILG